MYCRINGSTLDLDEKTARDIQKVYRIYTVYAHGNMTELKMLKV